MSSGKAVEILLIEDNAQDEELALRALKKSHLVNRIEVVRDGQAALDYLFGSASGSTPPHGKPKLVLLDLKLPKVSGLEILRRLKSDARTKVIPVVVLTSSREESDLCKSYELGVNSYIVKPVDSEKFFHAIEQLGLYWLLLNEMPG